jgi:hypothetical protein
MVLILNDPEMEACGFPILSAEKSGKMGHGACWFVKERPIEVRGIPGLKSETWGTRQKTKTRQGWGTRHGWLAKMRPAEV